MQWNEEHAEASNCDVREGCAVGEALIGLGWEDGYSGVDMEDERCARGRLPRPLSGRQGRWLNHFEETVLGSDDVNMHGRRISSETQSGLRNMMESSPTFLSSENSSPASLSFLAFVQNQAADTEDPDNSLASRGCWAAHTMHIRLERQVALRNSSGSSLTLPSRKSSSATHPFGLLSTATQPPTSQDFTHQWLRQAQ